MPTNAELQDKIKELEARNRELLANEKPLNDNIKELEKQIASLQSTISSLNKDNNKLKKSLESIRVEPSNMGDLADTWNTVLAAVITGSLARSYGTGDTNLEKFIIPRAIRVADMTVQRVAAYRSEPREDAPPLEELVGEDPMKDLQL